MTNSFFQLQQQQRAETESQSRKNEKIR